MSDPDDLYKTPEVDVSNSKNAELKVEKRILKDFYNLLTDEDTYVQRKRVQANIFLLLAFVGVGGIVILFLQQSQLMWLPLLLALMSGLFLGFGLWFASFVNNWPVIRNYIKKEKLLERYKQIKDLTNH